MVGRRGGAVISDLMAWPEVPTCHGEVRGTAEWQRRMLRGRGFGEPPAPDGSPDVAEDIRRCFYCGSLHPEDLIRAIESGAKLSGADWKYGWPHKFYVDGIRHAHEGVLRIYSATSGGIDPSTGEPHKGYRDVKWAPVGPLVGKFYNDHLLDAGYSTAAFARITETLAKHGGVRFDLDNGRLRYSKGAST